VSRVNIVVVEILYTQSVQTPKNRRNFDCWNSWTVYM